MASTGDEDGSDTDSVPDELFQRSSSAARGAENEFQYAQDPNAERTGESPESYSQLSVNFREERPTHNSGENSYLSEDDDRENRFEGPASTWHFYTESERALAASLDQQRANDLSIHLYNAHALKARVRDPDSDIVHHQAKKNWITSNNDGSVPWHPDTSWTAWPLRPGDVPRKGESFGVPVPSRDDERSTYKMLVPWKPSIDLEDEIQAIMLRKFKEQVRSRSRHVADLANAARQKTNKDASPRKRKRLSSSDSGRSSAPDDSASLKSSSSGTSLHDIPAEHQEHEVDLLIDEDEAAETLRPTVAHIIGKLDHLLLGLHNNRLGHIKDPPTPRSRSRYERRKSQSRSSARAEPSSRNENDALLADQDQIVIDSGSKNPSTSRGSRGRTTTVRGDADHEEDSSAGAESNKPKRKRPLNPRDWSEVLSVASLVGWDPAVVQRAAARCSSLFGESMTFTKLGNRVQAETAPHSNGTPGLDIEEEPEEEAGFSCPFEDCARHAEAWPLNKTWRWREHLKRVHKYSKAKIERVEREMKAKRTALAGDESGDEDAKMVLETKVEQE